MEEKEMLEQTSETENTETQAVEETEEVVAEETTNNSEATQEPRKTLKKLLEESEEYQEEFNDLVKNRLDRQKNKILREYDEKYGRLETVVNTGLGTSNVEEAVNKLTEFYEKKGVKIPSTPKFTDRQIEALAKIEAEEIAEEIISDGYDEIVKEVDRLASIGFNNMKPKDKVMYQRLAEERKKIEDKKSLASIGVDYKKVSEDIEFQEYAKNLNPALSLKKKYEMYLEKKPKPKIEKIGSMKTGKAEVKEFYTEEEISKLTEEELDNPDVWEAVRRSMTGQA